jgi:hypothetical protein
MTKILITILAIVIFFLGFGFANLLEKKELGAKQEARKEVNIKRLKIK